MPRPGPAPTPPSQTTAVNLGRQINFVNGITGIAPNGNAVINMPVNNRTHRLQLQCTAVNYSGGTAEATTTLTGSGIGATVTPTVVNGVITAATVVAGGSGYAVNDTITPVDATGQGAVLRVATVSSGAIATLAITSGGAPSPIDPAVFYTSVKELVNGVNMRDISADFRNRIALANGISTELGLLSLYYTEPFGNVLQKNERLSWDLFGQSTYQIQLGISPNVVSPGLIGTQEFDYQRNEIVVNGVQTPVLNPVAQHTFTWPASGGINNITTLPFNYPIRRIWVIGSTPGNITQLEVFQDGNKIFEAYENQAIQIYQDYGFQFGQPTYQNQNQSATAIKQYFNPNRYFDCAYISDPDQRYWKALSCQKSFIFRVYSAIAQTLTMVMEYMPGSYNS